METIAVRNRLKDLCERMMFLNPENYGRKAEELLWRKVFYDVIQLIKQNRKHVRGGSSLECAYRTHLSSAVGYYHHLLNKVQIEFNINVDGVVDWIHVTDSQTHTDKKENKKPVDPKAVEWAKNCCHHCLVYLGDLARYQQDQDGYRSTVLSQRYYHQALLWNADIGMPHNQLGTLSGNRHQSCDAAYHYMRCLMTFSPFDGAHANLQRLLEKNRRRYKELPQSDLRDLPPDLQRPKDIKKLLIEFMYLLDILQPDSTASTAEISEVCQRVLHDFNLCMYYTHSNGDQPIMPSIRGAEDDKEQFIPDDLVFKIVVMCLITIYRLQETGSEQVSASIAFTLALFSHVLNHLNSRIQSSLYDMEHPLAIIDSNDKDDSVLLCSSGHESEEDDQLTPQSTGTITPGNSQDVTYGNNSLKNRKKPQTKRVRAIHKLRRQRRGLEDDLDLSEGEEDLGSSQSDYSDSDSELSADDVLVSDSDSEDESLMESQELTPGFASRTHLLSDNHYQEPSKEDISNNVSLTNNLKDMSNQLFSQNPSASFLRRNIRLAPTFDAYVLDAKAQGESKTSEVAIEDGDRGEPTKVITEDPEDDE
uniref:Protein SMG5-like n=1 Tax=Saccoglossus kowalevskii TaxID=10224 RepID=A0ABM0MML2_SACKO